jgi:hypothetical protein
MKKTVFLSSTYEDLSEERRLVWNLLEKFEVNVRGMEKFGARTGSSLDTCLEEVDVADIYIGIIAFRLGSVEKNSGRSYTQLEYERAYGSNKDILIYMINEEKARVQVSFIDKDERRDKLEVFKTLLKERHTIATYITPDDLIEQLERDFRKLLQSKITVPQGEMDEFQEASEIIRRFLLVPNEISGKEIRLKIKMKGAAYPASMEICDSFNLVFGATVGIPVQILEPNNINCNGIDSLYLNAKQIDDISPIQDGEIRDIYAKLQFTIAKIDRVRARFSPKSEYQPPDYLVQLITRIPAITTGINVILPPDGMITLLLTHLLSDNNKLS